MARLCELWLGRTEGKHAKRRLGEVLQAFQELLGADGAALAAPEPTGYLAYGVLAGERNADAAEGPDGVQQRVDRLLVRDSSGLPGQKVTVLFQFSHGVFTNELSEAALAAAAAVLAASARMEVEKERSFGDFELLARLGEGGMARIQLARRRTENGGTELLALKRIRSHLAEKGAFLSLFSQEALAAAQVVHPNVVRILEFGVVEGQAYLAMEYLQGCSLARLTLRALEAGVELAVPVVVALVRQYCAGLQAVHERDVVHCDVSPQNLFVTMAGTGKLIDFGLARVVGRHTAGEPVRGKLGYLAPEQVAGEPFDHRADIFGLGVTGYELLRGGVASPGAALGFLNGTAPALHEVNPRVAPRLSEAVKGALVVEPAGRYPTAQAFAQALAAACREAGVEEASPGEVAVLMRNLFGDEDAAARRLLAGQPERAAPGQAKTVRFD